MRPRDAPALPRCGAAVVLCAILLATSLTAWAEPALERIRAEAQAGDYANALAQLDTRLVEHPDDRDARFLRAQVLAWSGDFTASRVAYDGLIAADPGNVDYLFGRSQAWLWLGEPERALEDVRAARALAPEYAALAEFESQALAALAACRPPVAQAPGLLEVIAQASWQNLDRGYDDWLSGMVAGRARVSTNTELRGAAAYQRRYGSDDVDMSLGATWFGGGGFEFGADLGAAAKADYLPEWSGQAHLLARVAPATSLLLAYRHAQYAATHNDTVSLTAEHYLDRFRLAYTLYRGDTADAPHTYSHVARVDYYYAEPNWVGVQYVNGKEAESDGAGGLLVSDVEGAAVLGRHALTSDWSLVWALTWHEQGELYQRAGFDVGLARHF
jgi:YaiO family outer membrane protein